MRYRALMIGCRSLWPLFGYLRTHSAQNILPPDIWVCSLFTYVIERFKMWSIYITLTPALECPHVMHSLNDTNILSAYRQQHDSLNHTNILPTYLQRHEITCMSRLLKDIGLFAEYNLCYRALFAKETCVFRELTNRSHPIMGTRDTCICSTFCSSFEKRPRLCWKETQIMLKRDPNYVARNSWRTHRMLSISIWTHKHHVLLERYAHPFYIYATKWYDV